MYVLIAPSNWSQNGGNKKNKSPNIISYDDPYQYVSPHQKYVLYVSCVLCVCTCYQDVCFERSLKLEPERWQERSPLNKCVTNPQEECSPSTASSLCNRLSKVVSVPWLVQQQADTETRTVARGVLPFMLADEPLLEPCLATMHILGAAHLKAHACALLELPVIHTKATQWQIHSG